MSDWWRCPNDPPCPHAGLFHDIYDYDDDSPTCCVEGCMCGHAATESGRAADTGQEAG